MSDSIEKKNLRRSMLTSVTSDICGAISCCICGIPLFTTLLVLASVYFNGCPRLATWNIVMYSLYIFGSILVINQKIFQLLCTISTKFLDDDECKSLGLCCSKYSKFIYHITFSVCSYLVLVSWDLYGIYLLITTTGTCSTAGVGLFLYILTLITVVVDVVSNTCSCLATLYVIFDCFLVTHLFIENWE
eukprot:gene8996-1095_t